MSVIVKGMRMPDTCEECQVSCEVGSDLHCQVTNDGNKWGWKKSDNGFESRPDWCPLCPLPERHGRLIEDAPLIRYFIANKGEKFDGEYIALAVTATPTVLQAEGEPDG